MLAISQETSLFLQCLATSSLLAELANADFVKSDYFKDLKFGNEDCKNILVVSGVGNPATMQMMLYALLVIPKEVLSRIEFESLDSKMKEINTAIYVLIEKTETYSTYNGENNISDIDYLRHIRNAVAHSKCEYLSEEGKNFVVFIDADNRNSNVCSIKIECYKVGTILMELQGLIMDYYSKTYQTEK